MPNAKDFGRAYRLNEPEPQEHEKPCSTCRMTNGHHTAQCPHAVLGHKAHLTPHFSTQETIERRPAPHVDEAAGEK